MKNVKKLFRRPSLWGVLFSIILTLFSGYSVLEAFVLPSDVVKMSEVGANAQVSETQDYYTDDPADSEYEDTDANEADSEYKDDDADPEDSDISIEYGEPDSEQDSGSGDTRSSGFTENSYTADGIQITITEQTIDNTQVYIADIQLDDPGRLLAGLADGSFGRNISDTTSNISSQVGAILAINGDYYGFRDSGYVMRNGYLYRSDSSGADEDLVIYEDGNFEIINESEVSAEELEAKGAVQIFSFGPALVNGGEVTVSEGEEVGQAMNSNPRTAIGQIGEGHYVFVVSDGRTSESAGLTLKQLADVMDDLGCNVAYNLDGGGSTTMVFNGQVVNKPTTNGHSIKERSVSDIVYIG